MGPIRTGTAVAVGAATAYAVDRLLRSTLHDRVAVGHAVGLAVAAAVYPALRSGDRRGTAARRELLAATAYAGVTAAALRTGSATGRRLAAAGWASHALFDAGHDAGAASHVPGWYPAVCAGYDLVLAGLLLRD